MFCMQKFFPKMARTGYCIHKKCYLVVIYCTTIYLQNYLETDCVMLLKFFITALWLNKRKLKKIPRRRWQRKRQFLARAISEALVTILINSQTKNKIEQC